MRPRPGTASQNRARARPASDLLRLSRRGRRHQQHLGAQTPPERDPAKSHKRLPSHVGRRSRSRCANNNRHCTAPRRQPIQRDRQHPGLSSPLIAKSDPMTWGWVIAKIGGWGTFVRYREIASDQAWSEYGLGNGVASRAALVAKVTQYGGKRA